MQTIRKIALAVMVMLFATAAYAQQYPKPTGYVNDFASLLSREQGASLNDELAAFEKKTTIEVAVVTVPLARTPFLTRPVYSLIDAELVVKI